MKKIIALFSLIAICGNINSIIKNDKQITNIEKNIFKQNLKKGNDILLEKDYRFLAHDWLKLKISYDIFFQLQIIYSEEHFEVKNKFFMIINTFPKLDNTGAGGCITQDDIFTVIKVIINNFKEINDYFKNLTNEQGLIIVTNTIGSWDKSDSMGVFAQ